MAYADSQPSFRVETVSQKTSLQAGLEFGMISLGQAISGFGIRLQGVHDVSSHWGVGLGFSQTLGNSNSTISALYSDLSGLVTYHFQDRSQFDEIKVFVDDHWVMSETRQPASIFSLQASIEQIFLNGATAVYPATGLALGLDYSFNLWRRVMHATGKYALLSATGQSATGLFLNLTMELPI